METKEIIKTSWRFRIANWILGGTLRKALDEVITNLEMFLTLSQWPTEHGVYMTVEPLENHLLIKSVDILLKYLTKHEDTIQFKLANFVCKHELRKMLRDTMYNVYDAAISIDHNLGSAGIDDIRNVRFSITWAEYIMLF